MNSKDTVFNHRAIADFYVAGNSITLCQKQFGCSYRTVKRAVLKFSKLRTIKEGVDLRHKLQGTRKPTDETRIKISQAAQKRFALVPKSEKYRNKRGQETHPTLGFTEKTWFRYLIEKANFSCQITGERGISLSVHHLNCVKSFPELRWDEGNVVVVDKKLHEKFHYQFMGNAQKKCTDLDWIAFLTTI